MILAQFQSDMIKIKAALTIVVIFCANDVLGKLNIIKICYSYVIYLSSY